MDQEDSPVAVATPPGETPRKPARGRPVVSAADARAVPDIATTLGLAGSAAPHRRFWRRPKFWIIGAVIGIGAATYYFMRGAPLPVQYSTVNARRGDLAVSVTATGTLAPLDTVIVGTEVSGVIDAVAVDYNDRVHKGETLAVVNTDLLRAQISQSRAAVGAAVAAQRQTTATLAQVRDQSARAEALFKVAVMSAQDVETARGDLGRAVAADSNARAQIDVATAALQVQLTTLEKATIRAPIDGIVLERQVEPGRTVAATFQTPVLFVLAADLRHMTLALNVDEADIGQVKAGERADFTVDAYPDHVFTGTVRTVHNASIMVEGVVTYQAILDVANDDLLLRPGMTATATVKTSALHDVLLVPNAALRFTPAEGAAAGAAGAPSGHCVWSLKQSSPSAIPVSIGLSDGLWTQVTAGAVEPGTPLVTGIALAKNANHAGSAPPRTDSSRTEMPLRTPRGG